MSVTARSRSARRRAASRSAASARARLASTSRRASCTCAGSAAAIRSRSSMRSIADSRRATTAAASSRSRTELPWTPGIEVGEALLDVGVLLGAGGLARGELLLDPRRRLGRAEDDERAGRAPALPGLRLGLDRLAQRAHDDRVLLAHAQQHQVQRQLEAEVLEEQREVEALVELDGDEDGLDRELAALGVQAATRRRGRGRSAPRRSPGTSARTAPRRSASGRAACRRTTARGSPGPGGRTAARPARTTWRPSPGRR